MVAPLWTFKGVLIGFLLLRLTSLIGSDLGFGSLDHAGGVQGSFFSNPLLGRQIKQHKSFLDSTYKVKGDKILEFCVRQVPGDGSCLFHSISAWLSFMQTGQHEDFDWRLRGLSLKLRHLAVSVLQQPDTVLTLEDGEEITTTQLVDVIAEQYHIKPAEYCTSMLDPRTWGGGPEIVALSQHLRCPIHVYQLCTERSFLRPFSAPQFKLEVCAKFGSPMFDAKQPICILCADGRFPNIAPGKQKAQGDHFLALFPACSSGTTSSAGTAQMLRAGTSDAAGSANIHVQIQQAEQARALGSTRIKLGYSIPRVLSYLNKRRRAADNSSANVTTPCLLRECPKMASDEMFREWIHESSEPKQPKTFISTVSGWFKK